MVVGYLAFTVDSLVGFSQFVFDPSVFLPVVGLAPAIAVCVALLLRASSGEEARLARVFGVLAAGLVVVAYGWSAWGWASSALMPSSPGEVAPWRVRVVFLSVGVATWFARAAPLAVCARRHD